MISSVWPLRDDEAAVFFERFYTRLAGGETIAGALASAQRDGLAAGEPVAAWAGLVVLGDGEWLFARDPSRGWSEAWPWVLGLALGAGALLVAVARLPRVVRPRSTA